MSRPWITRFSSRSARGCRMMGFRRARCLNLSRDLRGITTLGVHVARCEDCAHTAITYNSCLTGIDLERPWNDYPPIGAGGGRRLTPPPSSDSGPSFFGLLIRRSTGQTRRVPAGGGDRPARSLATSASGAAPQRVHVARHAVVKPAGHPTGSWHGQRGAEAPPAHVRRIRVRAITSSLPPELPDRRLGQIRLFGRLPVVTGHLRVGMRDNGLDLGIRRTGLGERQRQSFPQPMERQPGP